MGQPSPATTPEPPGVYSFFTKQEAETLSALTDRIIPGGDGIPSAREAGVVRFVDQRLARDQGVPTYTKPPFAKPYTGDTPPGPDTDDVIWVPAKQLYRYGIQDVQLPDRESYRSGIGAIDRWAEAHYGKPLTQLGTRMQDQVLDDLAKGKVDTFQEGQTPTHFFNLVLSDSAQGWMCDPMYGGNRDMATWKALRYPGAQRAYTPTEMLHGTTKKPQSFAQMHASVPGSPEEHALLPESGALAGRISGPRAEPEEDFVCRTSLG